MHTTIKRIMLVSLVAGLIIAKPAFAANSPEYTAMGKEAWSAFECSILAEKSKHFNEQERLFQYGYAKGLEFIEAFQAEKVKKEELSNSTPLMMLLVLQGPSPDFMLGRVFEGALDSALEDVYKTGEQFNSDEIQKSIAENKFRKQNCQLIGK